VAVGLKCDVHIDTGTQTGVFSRVLGSELLMDAISCVPLAAGLLASLLAVTELDGGFGVCLAACAFSVTVVTFLSRRWWLCLAALFASAAVWFATCILTDGLTDSIMYWRGFFEWLLSGAPHIPYAISVGYTTVVFFMAVFTVTLPVFVMLRRFLCFPIFVALQTGAVILSAAFGADDISVAVCFGASGLILLLPRVYAGYIEKSGATDSGSADRQRLSRARMQAVAVPAALLAVLFALWITPVDAHNWKSNLLSAWYGDINTLFTGRYREPTMAGSRFGMPGMWYQAETGRLGGPVAPTDELYLVVQAPRPVLLKGTVLDYYDGSGWYASRPDGNLRFNSLLWRGDRNDTFDLDKPVGNAAADSLFYRLTEDMSISVIHEKATFGTLYTAGCLYKITPGDRLEGVGAYFNRRSDVFTNAYVPHKAEYSMRTKVWNTRMQGFDELFTQLEELASDGKRYAYVLERYTQLPESLPDDVRRTAADITDGIGSPYMKADAISRWLAENNEYTLVPELPPYGVDFTAFFLDSREGYCVYYATAMTVLARCAGLPARYVQGFALANTPWSSNYQYRATGLTAHAWSEVYFEGIGWLTFDPLLWDTDAPLNETAGEDESSQTGYSPAPSQPPVETPPQQPEQNETRDGIGGSALLILILSGFIIPALYGLYRLALRTGPGRMARAWTYDSVCRRIAEPSKQLDAIYNDTLKLLALQGHSVERNETLVTFPERIDRIIVLDEVTLTELAGIMMNSHFGNTPPSGDEIKRACLYHSRLESQTQEVLGKRKYLFRRVIMHSAPGTGMKRRKRGLFKTLL